MNYSIHFDHIADKLNDVLTQQSLSSLYVLVDENTKKFCLPIFDSWIQFEYQIIEIESGETNKTIDTTLFIIEQLLLFQADRNAVLINLGGGVIGDMGGFAASIYKRGIKFIQIPTTLLSQVDASVGGKLGVDHQFYKNVIGVFNEPLAVFVDAIFLKTLPKTELLSGFAEMLKHALIADRIHWMDLLKIDINQQQVPIEYIQHSISIKREIVQSDPFEKGARKILNFGHTVGHAIESFLLEKNEPVPHGFAVAYGMMIESYISYLVGLMNHETYVMIKEGLSLIYTPILIENSWVASIVDLMYQDKKNSDGQIRIATINDISVPEYDISVSASVIQKALLEY